MVYVWGTHIYGTQLHGAQMGYRITGDALKWDSQWATAFRGQKFTLRIVLFRRNLLSVEMWVNFCQITYKETFNTFFYLSKDLKCCTVVVL
jgi:hypothetical protein